MWLSVDWSTEFISILSYSRDWHNINAARFPEVEALMDFQSQFSRLSNHMNAINRCDGWWMTHSEIRISQIARNMETTRGPAGSCRSQMGPMLAPWTLLSGILYESSRTENHAFRLRNNPSPWRDHFTVVAYIDRLVQYCSNSSALAMELLQSCTYPLIWTFTITLKMPNAYVSSRKQ